MRGPQSDDALGVSPGSPGPPELQTPSTSKKVGRAAGRAPPTVARKPPRRPASPRPTGRPKHGWNLSGIASAGVALTRGSRRLAAPRSTAGSRHRNPYHSQRFGASSDAVSRGVRTLRGVPFESPVIIRVDFTCSVTHAAEHDSHLLRNWQPRYRWGGNSARKASQWYRSKALQAFRHLSRRGR